MRYFFVALQVMGIFSNWASQAMADGKVSLKEVVRLAEAIASILGLPLEYDIPGAKDTLEAPPTVHRVGR